MKEGIILYKSKYGSTKKYAEWLARECGFDLTEVAKAKIKDVSRYKNVVLCGAIYASGIAGLSYLKKHYKVLADKNIAVFCVGASPFDKKALAAIKARNFKDGLEGLPLFYGRGAWNEEKMSFSDRLSAVCCKRRLQRKIPQSTSRGRRL